MASVQTAKAVDLMGPTPGQDTFVRFAVLGICLLLIWGVSLIPWSWPRNIAAASMVALTMVILIVTASSWIGDAQRRQASGQVGETLPRLTVIKRDGARLTHVLFPALLLDGRRTYLASGDGTVSKWGAANGLAGDNLVVVDYPHYGLDEDEAFPYILKQLRTEGLDSLVVWGVSYGGQVADRFHDWYNSLAADEQIGPLQGLAFISAPPGRDQVKMAWQRGMMGITRHYSMGPVMDFLWKHGLWMLAGPYDAKAQAHMAEADWGLHYKEMRRGQRDFTATRFFANAAAIYRSKAFRLPNTGPKCPVFMLNLPDENDNVIKVSASAKISMRKYPHAHRLVIREGGHGQLFEWGPNYAKLFREILELILAGI